MHNNRWLLPEGIEEVLPPQADRLEQLRRDLLDLFRRWGYELVFPPFAEYLDSLLTGTGKDLDLRTFKITDQLTGRMMGVRADITPQVARIDAHQLRRSSPTRLCYLGTVLKTRPEGLGRSRTPLQIGAELFGHHGVESDLEVLCLMMAMLDLAGLRHLHLDLGHVGIFRGLSVQAGLDQCQEMALFDALQRKSMPEVGDLVHQFELADSVAEMFLSLAELNGPDALSRAETALAAATDDVRQSLAYLQAMASQIQERLPRVPVHYDLAELRAYNYQTGIVFAAFVPSLGHEVARGGRYDHVGESFGRARPATGFSADILNLIRLSQRPVASKISRIFAPASEDPSLRQKIACLRDEGQIVIQALPKQEGGAAEMGCDQQLTRQGGSWTLAPI